MPSYLIMFPSKEEASHTVLVLNSDAIITAS